jgi:hypothetical protein
MQQLDQKIEQLTEMRNKLDEYFGGCKATTLDGACTPITEPLDN